MANLSALIAGQADHRKISLKRQSSIRLRSSGNETDRSTLVQRGRFCLQGAANLPSFFIEDLGNSPASLCIFLKNFPWYRNRKYVKIIHYKSDKNFA